MATYSYLMNNKWIDINVKNINEARAKILAKYGKDLKKNRNYEIWFTRNDIMIGSIWYNSRLHRFEWGDDKVAYGSVNESTGRLTYDD